MIDFDTITVIDDFLPKEQFEHISSLVMNTSEDSFPFYVQKDVADDDENADHWSWYATHTFFVDGEEDSNYFPIIKEYFLDRFRKDLKIMSGYIRVKANFYGWTPDVRHHNWHIDYSTTKNKGALFSLNTCDGSLVFKDGTKVDSVANRIVFFDAHHEHRSSTTSNSYGRYNINFNFV